MALLKSLNTVPAGGFVYRQAETALRVEADNFTELVSKVISHRKYKGLKPDDPATVSIEVQRQICTRLGTDQCKPEAEGDTWVPVPNGPRIKLDDIIAFSRVVFEFIKSGGQLVDMAEAQRRRSICVNCPLNQRAQGCKCSIFYKMINSIIPKERRWDDLHVCGICHCSNAAKVNVPMEVIQLDRRKLKFPVNCWQSDA